MQMYSFFFFCLCMTCYVYVCRQKCYANFNRVTPTISTARNRRRSCICFYRQKNLFQSDEVVPMFIKVPLITVRSKKQ